jgi:hypothetical protein
VQTGGRLVGWSVRADGGTVQINFRDGRADGDVIAVTPLLAAGATRTSAMPAGVAFAEGLYVEVTGTGGHRRPARPPPWIGAAPWLAVAVLSLLLCLWVYRQGRRAVTELRRALRRLRPRPGRAHRPAGAAMSGAAQRTRRLPDGGRAGSRRR